MSEHDIADRQAQRFITTPPGVATAASVAARTAADSATEAVSCRLGDASCASAHAASISRSPSGRRSSVHRSLLKLQRQYGNHYVGQVLRQANAGEHDGSMDAIERSIEGARGGGQGMDHGTRTRMESAFGTDFSSVRIHTDSRADGLSQSLSARAFTTGRDVFFRQGEYNPGASSGRELLAHELTHVVQQNGGGIHRKMTVSQPGDAHEVEADQMARQVMLQEHVAQRQPEVQVSLQVDEPWVIAHREPDFDRPVARKCAACDVEEPLQRTATTSASGPLVQRWPFSEDKGDDVQKGSDDGVLGWIGEKANTVSDAAEGAVDWVKKQGGAAADSVADAGNGAFSWAKEQGGAGVKSVSQAGSGAYDWAKVKADQLRAKLLEQRRLNVLAQISGAQRRLAAQESLPISDSQLSTLNGHLASLREKSNGLINVPGINAKVAGGESETGEKTVGTSTIGDLLASLQASLSTPTARATPSSAPDASSMQRTIQRFMDPATAAAIAAASAVAEETLVAGAPVAAVAAPETAGISLIVLAIVVVVVAIVVAIIVYAATRPNTPAPKAEPRMPEGLSREKKEKWKDCRELYETYKPGTAADVGSLGAEIKALKGKYDSLTPKEKTELCAKVHQQISLVERLIDERRRYIDTGCDEFDWFEQGLTEEQRREKHEGEVDNVKGQEGNLRGLLKKLQDEGVC